MKNIFDSKTHCSLGLLADFRLSILGLLFSLFLTPPLLASPTILLSPTLQVGEDLRISVSGANLNHAYSVRLVDELGYVINHIPAPSDGNGVIDLIILWQATGVVGCDSGTIHNPAVYQFADYDLANSNLDGRTFTVELLGQSGSVKESAPVDLLARWRPIYYFSDSQGCPRKEFLIPEAVYVSGRQVPLGVKIHFALFVTPEELYLGMDLSESVEISETVIFHSEEVTGFTEWIAESSDLEEDDYMGIARKGEIGSILETTTGVFHMNTRNPSWKNPDNRNNDDDDV